MIITNVKYNDSSGISVKITYDNGVESVLSEYPSDHHISAQVDAWVDEGNTIEPYAAPVDAPAENLNITLGEDYVDAGEALDTADAVRTKTGSVGVITDRPAFDGFMVSAYLAVDTGVAPDPVPNTLYQALKLGSKSQVELHRDASNVWCKLWGTPNGLECRFEAGFSNAFTDTGLGYWIATGLPERTDVRFLQDGVEISEAIIIPGSAEDPLNTFVWHGVPAVPYAEGASFVANVDGDQYPDKLVVELPGGGKLYEDADSIHLDTDGSGRADVTIPK